MSDETKKIMSNKIKEILSFNQDEDFENLSKKDKKKYFSQRIDELYDFLLFSDDFKPFKEIFYNEVDYETQDFFYMYRKYFTLCSKIKNDEIFSKLEELAKNYKAPSLKVMDVVRELRRKTGAHVSGPGLLDERVTNNCHLILNTKKPPNYFELENFYKANLNSAYRMHVPSEFHVLFRVLMQRHGTTKESKNFIFLYLSRLFGFDAKIVITWSKSDAKEVFPGYYYDGEKFWNLPIDGVIKFKPNIFKKIDSSGKLVCSNFLLEDMMRVIDSGYQIEGVDRTDVIDEYYRRKLVEENKKVQTVCNLLDHYVFKKELKRLKYLVKKFYKSVEYFDNEKHHQLKFKCTDRNLKNLSPVLKKYSAHVSGSYLLQFLGVTNFEPGDIDVFVGLDLKNHIKEAGEIYLSENYYAEYEDVMFNPGYVHSELKILTDKISEDFRGVFDGSSEFEYTNKLIGHFTTGDLKIQLIFYDKSSNKIQDVIEKFDFDFIKFLYDGSYIRGSIDAYHSILDRHSNYRPNIKDVMFNKRENFYYLHERAKRRLDKYKNRGFSFSFMGEEIDKDLKIDARVYSVGFYADKRINIEDLICENFFTDYFDGEYLEEKIGERED